MISSFLFFRREKRGKRRRGKHTKNKGRGGKLRSVGRSVGLSAGLGVSAPSRVPGPMQSAKCKAGFFLVFFFAFFLCESRRGVVPEEELIFWEEGVVSTSRFGAGRGYAIFSVFLSGPKSVTHLYLPMGI